MQDRRHLSKQDDSGILVRWSGVRHPRLTVFVFLYTGTVVRLCIEGHHHLSKETFNAHCHHFVSQH